MTDEQHNSQRQQNDQHEETTAPQPLRVALLADADTLLRISSTIHHICTGLTEHAVKITLVVPEGVDPQILPLPARVVFYRWGVLPWQSVVGIRDLAAQLASHNVQLLHSLSGRCAYIGTKLARTLSRPYVVSYTGLTHYECHSPLDENLCKGLIALSRPIYDLIKDMYPAFAGRLMLLRPCCHIPISSPARPGMPIGATQTPTTTTVLAIGAMDAAGGFDLLLHAAAEVLKQELDAMFFLAGGGAMENALRRFCTQRGLNNRVTFIPPLDRPRDRRNLLAVLRTCDVFVLPAQMKLLAAYPYEAMAAGAAVVAPDGGALDVIEHQQTGMVFQDGDVHDLADKLTQVLADGRLRTRLGAAAGQYVKNNLSVSSMVETLMGLYYRCIQGQARSGVAPGAASGAATPKA